MNIKSLLLGSAAALVAVSGARAADAVVIAEPEPMEYVRVCDTYGTGFYYIPGTETCLKVCGYIRYDIGVGERFQDFFDKEISLTASTTTISTRTTPTTSAAASSSASTPAPKPSSARCVPTLRSTSTTTSTAGVADDIDDDDIDGVPITTTADELGIEHAYVELGGFRIGMTDSLFSTFTGYSSGVSNDGLIPYGPFTTHQIAYTFTAATASRRDRA